jgi:hypothetical protein
VTFFSPGMNAALWEATKGVGLAVAWVVGILVLGYLASRLVPRS